MHLLLHFQLLRGLVLAEAMWSVFLCVCWSCQCTGTVQLTDVWINQGQWLVHFDLDWMSITTLLLSMYKHYNISASNFSYKCIVCRKKATFLLRLKSKILEWIINTLAKNFGKFDQCSYTNMTTDSALHIERPVNGLPIFFHHSSVNLLKDAHLSTIPSYSNTVKHIKSLVILQWSWTNIPTD